MFGVSSLAGYLRTHYEKRLIFVMIVNNFVGDLRAYRQLEDRLCLYLIGHVK